MPRRGGAQVRSVREVGLDVFLGVSSELNVHAVDDQGGCPDFTCLWIRWEFRCLGNGVVPKTILVDAAAGVGRTDVRRDRLELAVTEACVGRFSVKGLLCEAEGEVGVGLRNAVGGVRCSLGEIGTGSGVEFRSTMGCDWRGTEPSLTRSARAVP